MIRTFAIATAVLGLLTANAAAQNALSFWQGAALIDSASNACKNGGLVAAGNVFNSSYRARLNNGEPNSGITFVSGYSMLSHFNAGGGASDQMHGNGNYAARLLTGAVTSIPNPNNASLINGTYKFKIKPNPVAADTDNITIEGTITNWRGVANCTVKFRAAYRANPLNVIP